MKRGSRSSMFFGSIFMLTILAYPLRAETEETIKTRDDITLSFVVTKRDGQTDRLNQLPYCLPAARVRSNFGKVVDHAAKIFWSGHETASPSAVF